MSSWYPLIKWLHIVSSTVLLGAGGGISLLMPGVLLGPGKIARLAARLTALSTQTFITGAVNRRGFQSL